MLILSKLVTVETTGTNATVCVYVYMDVHMCKLQSISYKHLRNETMLPFQVPLAFDCLCASKSA